MNKKEFDHLANKYKESITPWMRITGESIEFYAQSRIKWVANQLKIQGCHPHKILDFGCGVGIATPIFVEEFGSDCQIIGIDVSSDSLEIARSKYGSTNISFHSLGAYIPSQSIDLAFCNGVFHHIPLNERDGAVRYIYNSLQPGGFFAFWENNPWNPLMKYNMAHAEIDRKAIPIVSPNAKRLITSNGFELLKIRYCFIFPKFLKFLGLLETSVSRFPIGAQYVVLSRKVS